MYKYRHPKDADEAGERFTLVEERGDRVLVEDASPYWNGKIRPLLVYRKADMEEVPSE